MIAVPKEKIVKIVTALKSKDFATAVPVPTVAVSTPDFSSDLDRGPMWEQQVAQGGGHGRLSLHEHMQRQL